MLRKNHKIDIILNFYESSFINIRIVEKLISTQNYITGCPKFCFKTEIGLKMNGAYSYEKVA
ncbi:hypothetical protein [Leptospira santarosai]|uniref:hypothetical protein n=1 Tax=Leptospira santarosai TaxID=28183 RepID=UPI0039B12662